MTKQLETISGQVNGFFVKKLYGKNISAPAIQPQGKVLKKWYVLVTFLNVKGHSANRELYGGVRVAVRTQCKHAVRTQCGTEHKITHKKGHF